MLILRNLWNLLGQPNNKEDVDELLSQLRQTEEQVNDLKERLKTSTSNVEQYRAMVTSLEESLNKEKQVYTILNSIWRHLLTCCFLFFYLGACCMIGSVARASYTGCYAYLLKVLVS